uniref:Uncharacterized protein n=1 Tax=Palpitomonas bilix TaxID=652834 RepID=A0A7S3D880_9EUKA
MQREILDGTTLRVRFLRVPDGAASQKKTHLRVVVKEEGEQEQELTHDLHVTVKRPVYSILNYVLDLSDSFRKGYQRGKYRVDLYARDCRFNLEKTQKEKKDHWYRVLDWSVLLSTLPSLDLLILLSPL